MRLRLSIHGFLRSQGFLRETLKHADGGHSTANIFHPFCLDKRVLVDAALVLAVIYSHPHIYRGGWGSRFDMQQ